VNRRLCLLFVLALLAAGCGSHAHTPAPAAKTVKVQTGGGFSNYLKRRVRPIGRGVRFHPPVSGEPTGRCAKPFKPRFEAHIEVFGANKVLLLPAGIGTGAPRHSVDGQLTSAACFGNVVTLNDEGILYLRRGSVVTLQTLFKAWGEPLTQTRIASFADNAGVRVFVDGRRRRGDPRTLRIRPRAEIVIEAGPYVPPHTRFAYPAFPQVS
jgi:hypothetical protein